MNKYALTLVVALACSLFCAPARADAPRFRHAGPGRYVPYYYVPPRHYSFYSPSWYFNRRPHYYFGRGYGGVRRGY